MELEDFIFIQEIERQLAEQRKKEDNNNENN